MHIVNFLYKTFLFTFTFVVATELLIPSEHCLSCCGTSRKPVLDNKYYVLRIYNIESIGQDGCMTEQSFAKSSSVSYDRLLDTLT